MPKEALTHDCALKLVCAVCVNQRGVKARRSVSEKDEERIQRFVFAGYRRGSPSSPQGLCESCHRLLIRKEKSEESTVKFLLPDDYYCELPHFTRKKAQETCQCRWCVLARMDAVQLQSFKKRIREENNTKPVISRMCHSCGKGVPVTQKSHSCKSSDLNIVQNMLKLVPAGLKGKLAHSLLRELQEEQNDVGATVQLPPANGGRNLVVHLGKEAGHSGQMKPMTHDEMIKSSAKIHNSGAQLLSQAADLRAKWGRKCVQPGLQAAIPIHNNRLNGYFDVQEMPFIEGNLVDMKPVWFCTDTVALIQEVKRLRNLVGVETENLLQGDTGQGWTKICLSIIKKSDLEHEPAGVRLPAAGLYCMEEEEEEENLPGPSKRAKRRTRAEGVSGGQGFKDWGSRKMLLVAVVKKVTENHENIKILFDAIQSDSFSFKLTGDFAFMSPAVGCAKGCGSSNPCLICDAQRTKQGGTKPRWVNLEQANLRTLGDQYNNYNKWFAEGSKSSAAATRKWKSVCGQPLLSLTQGRNDTDLILQLVVPGPLHVYLGFNEIVNYAEKTGVPNIKELFSQVAGVQVHMYMGKVGNYEGPMICKIFRHLKELRPHLMGNPESELYFATFVAFHEVSQTLLSQANLQVDWREKLHKLCSLIHQLNISFGMPVTPKLHILTIHIEQWVDLFKRALGREGEQGGEAAHHIWRRLLETLGEPKTKQGPIYEQFIRKALLIFNSNNV